MTALELVQGAVVKKVTRRAGSEFEAGRARGPAVEFDVTVALPDGGEVRLSASSATAWRRVVKRAQLRLTSKSAKAAAVVLRERIAEAVRAEKANPGAALLDAKVMERAEKNQRKRLDKAEAEKREWNLRTMKGLMVETRISREELLELWNSSVLADVMRA